MWVTAQATSRFQRLGRYTPDSIRHPAKMLPAIARHAITTYTRPGDLVLDPMCGIGTTLVEAAHLSRDALGIEYEAEWARLAEANLRHAYTRGASGHASVLHADARRLPDALIRDHAGTVRLLLTSPPYGPTNHGRVRTAGYAGHTGKVDKQHHRYGADRDNLAYRPTEQLLDGFTDILHATRPLLAPGAIVAITARPWRRGGELIDLPSAVFAAGRAAGLTPVERCVALLARYEHHPADGERLIAHGSFFQLKNIRDARAFGRLDSLLVHEDVLVLSAPEEPEYNERGE
ncbi:site-specific DNA-methyltransferase [Actinocrinis puniceicyclus]|uniref:Methyltransferase n=1 Tax=Actinocrinis puniceicyclus TaxID=977794 RepID=A0A8J7WU80_9ACTN|nr:DNA methyltransferase [Actinocrinis puniceicyclus]MBS2966830.1 site-specific DNA-methyltransferase [Actinocrinis puniceicyclus]